MKKKLFIGLVLLMSGFLIGALSMQLVRRSPMFTSTSAAAPGGAEAVRQAAGAFSDVVRAVSPAVVNISALKVHRGADSTTDDPIFDLFNDFFGRDFGRKNWREQSLGSGVIVSADGLIITNHHVVSNAEKIKVTLFDKRVFTGKVIGADPKSDIAVVRIASGGLPTIPWGDSDRLQVGEFVLAIGNPYGLSHTVTMGIISAVGRANVGIADYEDFIQTDAAINPGNSGGPLVNANGGIVGINTAIFSRSGGYQGIGFAVPANMVSRILEQLVKEGRVIRGWLGISIQELTPEIGSKFGHGSLKGALVSETQKGGPAEKAGLRRGDIILEYDGKSVEGAAELKNMVAKSRPGSKVPLSVLRKGKNLNFMSLIGEPPGEPEKTAPEPASEIAHGAFSGLNVMTLTEEVSKQLGVDGDAAGVVVTSVQDGSPAGEAGIRKGDVILEIDNTRVSDINDFNRISSGLNAEETVLMFINRGGKRFYITLMSS